jgi:hypothetical protein
VFAPTSQDSVAGWQTFRYGGVCAGTLLASAMPGAGGNASDPSGLAPVVVTVSGYASTGIDPALLRAANLSVALDPPLPATYTAAFFAAAAAFNASNAPFYSGRVPLLNVARHLGECAVDTDCPVLDACTVPRCSRWPAGTAGSPAAFGCCKYALSGACNSADPQVPTGSFVASQSLLVLPREVAGALPMPPPPAGLLNGSATDMALRNRAANPSAILWDPRSLWWAYWRGQSEPRPASAFATPYVLSDASYADDSPVEQVDLPFPFPFLGASLRSLWVSPNGFLRTVAGAPCNATFVGSGCGLGNAYVGLIAPLLADFDPKDYRYSEVWRQAYNVSGLVPTGGFPSVAAGAPLAASSAVFCTAFMNMGLWRRTIDRLAPPSPSFTTHVCVHGDGGIRMRYGAVLNVAAPDPNSWTAATTIAGWGGPPNTSDWLAGVRGLSAGDGISSTAAAVAAFGDLDAFGTADVPVNTPSNVLLSRGAVRQGVTAALCSLTPVACANTTCGAAGSTLSLQWSLPGCGAGFDPLLFAARTVTATTVPRVDCVFGGVAAPAQPTLNPPGSAQQYRVTCQAPPLGAFGADAADLVAGGGNVTVPVTLQLVLPAAPTGYAANGDPNLVVANRAVSPAGTFAQLGTGPAATALDAVAGTVTVPLPVYAVEAAFRAVPPANSSAGGSSTVQQETLVPRQLTFTYRADASACGCRSTAAAGSSAGVCDSCGVCGGDGRTLDCAGVCFGTASVDDCGVCSGGSTQKAPNANKDCNGVCFGPGDNCPYSPDNPGIAEAAAALTIIVIVALVSCSAALFSMLAYCAWIALVQRRRYADAFFWEAEEAALAPAPGLSQDTLGAMQVLVFGEPAPPGAPASGGAADGSDAGKAKPSVDVPGAAPAAGSPPAVANPMVSARSPGPSSNGASAAAAGGDPTGPAAPPTPGTGAREGDDTCAVCLETYAAGDRLRVMPPCRHRFHVACADEWLALSTACPVCRADLRGPTELAEHAAYERQIAEQRAARAAGRPLPTAQTTAVAGTDGAPGPGSGTDAVASGDGGAAAAIDDDDEEEGRGGEGDGGHPVEAARSTARGVAAPAVAAAAVGRASARGADAQRVRVSSTSSTSPLASSTSTAWQVDDRGLSPQQQAQRAQGQAAGASGSAAAMRAGRQGSSGSSSSTVAGGGAGRRAQLPPLAVAGQPPAGREAAGSGANVAVSNAFRRLFGGPAAVPLSSPAAQAPGRAGATEVAGQPRRASINVARSGVQVVVASRAHAMTPTRAAGASAGGMATSRSLESGRDTLEGYPEGRSTASRASTRGSLVGLVGPSAVSVLSADGPPGAVPSSEVEMPVWAPVSGAFGHPASASSHVQSPGRTSSQPRATGSRL